MIKLISIFLFAMILTQDYYSQQKIFGYKISGSGDIISDVFLIQNGSVLDSAISMNKTYRFEYNEEGKLLRDVNFIFYLLLDSTGPRPKIINVPGYRHYFYNQKGDIDSVGTGIWNGIAPETDTAGYRFSYSYDNKENLLSKITSSNGDTLTIEENSYDSSGNLILNKVIQKLYSDTTYNIREYDSMNRLTLTKSIHGINPIYTQFVYKYDSSGNLNCTNQTFDGNSLSSSLNYYLEFDEYGKTVYEIFSRLFNPSDSSWLDNREILFDYDEDNRILKMGPTAWFHYNADGNLDTLANTHPIDAGFLGGRATLVDSYGNKIRLPEYFGTVNFYYSKLVTDIKNEVMKVSDFTLSQNYPNPFNPSTVIAYKLPEMQKVTIKVFDVLGNEVETLVNEEKPAGNYQMQFNAKKLSSGVYFYRMQAGSFNQTRKLLLLK